MKRKIIIGFASLMLCSLLLYQFIFVPIKVDTNSLLTVGTSADFPSFAYMDKGAIKGFDIDLAQELARRMGKDLSIVDLPFFTLIPELNFGSLDMIVGGVTKTDERAKRVLFSDPYIENIALLVITRAGETVTSLDDLRGKTVIVNDGYTADLFMSEIKDKYAIDLERIPSVAESFIALDHRQAYAFVSAENTVGPFFEKFGKDNFSIYRLPDGLESYNIAVAKNNKTLIDAINAILHDMRADGTLRALKQKWNLTDD